jgi:hypothetical protein
MKNDCHEPEEFFWQTKGGKPKKVKNPPAHRLPSFRFTIPMRDPKSANRPGDR